MKFVVAWTVRSGLSEDQLARGLKLGERAQNIKGLKYLEFLGRTDGNGGFAVVEADGPEALLQATSLYTPYTECAAYAVMEMESFAQITGASAEIRAGLL